MLNISDSINPIILLKNLKTNYKLIQKFSKRDIEGRYRGSFLGLAWSFVTPIIMLSVYAFIFGIVMNVRWGIKSGIATFSLEVFAGMIAFTAFSDPVTRSPSLIYSIPNFVKKVVFPLEIIPVSTVITGYYHSLLSTMVLGVGIFALHHSLPSSFLLLPILILPISIFALGLSWFLSALGVYIRDISNVVGVAIQILMYATPIFYPIQSVPEPFKTVINLNPLTLGISMFRDAAVDGIYPSLLSYLYLVIIALLSAWIGSIWFNLSRRGFADVL